MKAPSERGTEEDEDDGRKNDKWARRAKSQGSEATLYPIEDRSTALAKFVRVSRISKSKFVTRAAKNKP